MILNIESKYDKIADELGSYMYCEVSNDFFEKLEHGCYNDTLTIIGEICLVFLIARIIVWFLSKILE